VGTIIDDLNWYDFIKLIAVFARKIGYKGLVVFIDECVNLYKLPNKISRENNYEKILSMFNDTLQGKAEGIGIFLGGTPQFLEDNRRGLYSYDALRSRLTDGQFVSSQYKNLMGPVIRLERLSDDEIFALALRIHFLHRNYYGYEDKISESDILNFFRIYMSRVGAGTLVTPREIIRDLLTILDILYQNPEADFNSVIKREEKNFNANPVQDDEAGDEAEDAAHGSVPDKTFELKFEDLEV
jgi:hypothetical protein